MANEVQSAVNALGAHKTVFLADVQVAINSHISKQSWQECLTIVQRYDHGSIRSTWIPEVSKAYWGRMSAFLRGKRYDGWQLDSKLTDGVVNVVTKKFEAFYKDHAKDLSTPLTQHLLKNRVFAEQLADHIIDATKGPLPSALKKQLSNQIVQILENTTIGDHIKNTAIVGITTAVNTVIAYAVSSSVVSIMIQHMAVFLKGAIVKVLATTAFKTMIVTAVKAIAKAKIVAFLIAIFGSILGAVPIWAIIAPLLVAFIAYQVSTLPEKMGAKVSVAVRQELSGNFDNLNRDVVNQIMQSFTSDALSTLAKDLAADLMNDPEFKNNIGKL